MAVTSPVTPTVALSALVESPSNPRQSFDATPMAELTASVVAQGIIEPLVVRPLAKGKYEVVCGARRYRAAVAAGLSDVPVTVRQLSDVEVLQLQVIENQQRADVHPIEEAAGYAALRDKHGMGVPEIATSIGMSVGHIYARLKLSSLQGPCHAAFLDGRITAGHAVLLARLAPAVQDEVAENGLYQPPYAGGDVVSVRTLGSWIEQHVQRKLSKAPWALDAPMGALPACTECPYNSDNDGGNAAKGLCLDGGCYAAKADLGIESKRQAAEAKGTPLVAITDQWSSDNGSLGSGKYALVRAQDRKAKGAERAIYVDGKDKGKEVWITRKGSKAGADAGTSLDARQAAQERMRRQITKGRRDAFRDVAIELWNADKDKVGTNESQHALLRVLAESLLNSAFHSVHFDQFVARHELVAEGTDLKKVDARALVVKHVKDLDALQLLGFCVESQLQGHIAATEGTVDTEGRWHGPDRLSEVGKLVGVKPAEYVAEYEREAKASADAKAAKAQAARDKELAQVKAIRAERAAEAKAEAEAAKAKPAKAAKGKAKAKAKAR